MKNRTSTSDKRSQFVEEKAFPVKTLVFGIGLLVLAATAGYFILARPVSGSASGRATNIGPQNYTGNVPMANVEATVKNRKISFSLSAVKDKKIVLFRDANKQVPDRSFETQALPMVAYISPKGDLVTAISMCEPCKSVMFHIEPDQTLTCDVCGTKFNAETLAGISGACVDYPPVEVTYKVKGDKVLINESEVAGWKPRI